MKLNLAPGKVAVKRLAEKAKMRGGLELPASRTKLYDLAEIVTTGNLQQFGYEGKDSTAEEYKPGQIVLFQLPPQMAGMVAHEIGGILHIFLNAADIIARLDKDEIALENFHVAGRFALLRPTVRNSRDSKIIIPDTAEEAKKESIHFSVVQLGKDVKLDLYSGQEVFPHRGRANPIVIDNDELCFIDQQFIDGALVMK